MAPGYISLIYAHKVDVLNEKRCNSFIPNSSCYHLNCGVLVIKKIYFNQIRINSGSQNKNYNYFIIKSNIIFELFPYP